MIMVKKQKFKAIEFDTGIVILQAGDSLAGRKDAAELIVADMPTIAEYLVRYHEYRAYGFDLREANKPPGPAPIGRLRADWTPTFVAQE